jgi:hypothetical protein
VRDFLQRDLLQQDLARPGAGIKAVPGGRPAPEALENPTVKELLDRARKELDAEPK